jgi:hypothetical protein
VDRSGRQWTEWTPDSASSFRLREATLGEPRGYVGPASAESGHSGGVMGSRLFCGQGNAGSGSGGTLAWSGGCRKETLQSVGKRLRGGGNAVILAELG